MDSKRRLRTDEAQRTAILRMHKAGETQPRIAKSMGLSTSTVYRVIRQERGEEAEDPWHVKTLDEMPPEVAACLEFSTEGFCRFYDRYADPKVKPLAPHLRGWMDAILGNSAVLINVPPRHAKSFLCSIWLPLWLISMNRNEQILIASQTHTFARKFSRTIASHLETNDLLTGDLGQFKPRSRSVSWGPNAGELYVNGRDGLGLPSDLSIQIRGAGQQVLGMEASWIIADDVVSRKSMASRNAAEELSDWYHGDLLTRLESDTRVAVIGQRMGVHDLYGELAEETYEDDEGKEQKVYTHINFPAVIREPDPETGAEAVVLWPEKWGYSKLMRRKALVQRKYGRNIWETMFQQNVHGEGSTICSFDDVYGDSPGICDRNRTLGRGLEKSNRLCRFISVDPSPTEYWGFICADIPLSNDRDFGEYVIDLERDKMSVAHAIGVLDRFWESYGPVDYLVIESNASQHFRGSSDFTQWMSSHSVRLIKHATTANKTDHLLGVSSLGVEIREGRVSLPYGDAESRRKSGMLIDELLEWPNGRTDDLAMAMWFPKGSFRRLVPRWMQEDPVKARSGEVLGTALRTPGHFHIPTRLREGWGGAFAK